MSDPLSIAAIGAVAALASKDIIVKLLGPSADYLGDGTKNLVEKASQNVNRILQTTCAKLKSDIDKPGHVNSRVFKNIWDQARFVEDIFTTEYFAGLLASSRTDDGKDDTALPLIALAKSLSSDQLRLHFVIYSLIAKYPFSDKERDSNRFWDLLELSIPDRQILPAVGLSGPDALGRLLLALQGLIQCNLLESRFELRIGDLRKGDFRPRYQDEGIVVFPNERGASLFMRALGLRGVSPEIITSVNVDYSLSNEIRAAISLPTKVSCVHLKRHDPLSSLQSEVDEKIDDFSYELTSVQRDIEKLEEKIDLLKEAND